MLNLKRLLRSALGRSGLSARTVSTNAGLPATTVSRWLAHVDYEPRVAKVLAVADVLGIPHAEVFAAMSPEPKRQRAARARKSA